MSVSFRWHLWLALAAISHATPLVSTSHILARDDDKFCSGPDVKSCPSSLPDNFCCPTGTSCLALAGNTSALCCPEGSDCSLIQPITCDLSEQDPETNPDAVIKTSVSDVSLDQCGDNTCCPFGYSCAGDHSCQKNADQSKEPGEDDNSSSSSTGVTSTATASKTSSTVHSSRPTAITTDTSALPSVIPGPATTTSTETSATSSPTADSQQPQHEGDGGASTSTIVGGVVAGSLVILVVAIFLFLCIRRRNRRRAQANAAEQQRRHRRPQMRQHPAGSLLSGSSNNVTYGNIISGPISQPESGRSDFIRRPNSMRSSLPHRSAQPEAVAPAAGTRRRTTLFPRISIPNPFSSPNPSARSPAATEVSSRASTISSSASDDYRQRPRDPQLPPLPRTGTVGARLAPIRAMRASSRHVRHSTAPQIQAHEEPSSENINVFADPVVLDDGPQAAASSASPPPPPPTKTRNLTDVATSGGGGRVNPVAPDVPSSHNHTRNTTFTDLMHQADLSAVHKGEGKYVPCVPGTTPRI